MLDNNRAEAGTDILLLICGTKPYEIVHTMKLLEQYSGEAVFIGPMSRFSTS